MLQREWRQGGSRTTRLDLPSNIAGKALLVQVDERGVDVELEALDRNGTVIERSDGPVGRNASQWLVLAGNAATTLVVHGKGPAGLDGSVQVRGIAIPSVAPAGSLDCTAILRKRAAGDEAYALGHAIELARVQSSVGAERAAFESAARAYREALAMAGEPDHSLQRGELQLTLAALSYDELQDWSGSAAWAQEAAATFAKAGDSYRRARAQATLAAAWMELATRSAAGQLTVATPERARLQLDKARSLLARLAELHAPRHEIYDQALQINNIGVAYIYEARFEDAIPYLSRARAVFARLGDSARTAMALQNIALSEWGLGRLSRAVLAFDHALELIGPTPYPQQYLTTLNNSGLVHYAAGRFDEALRLQNEALDFATRTQADRARARSYYGIGVTYYAIGDRDLAKEFLQRALVLCTPELDARVRVATLRALAQVEYERGQHNDAIAHDSEALKLATAPSARARILLRLAQDYAVEGNRGRAADILAGVISKPPEGDELVRAMARVQAGTLQEDSGNLERAEADLTEGLNSLQRFDAVPERFEGLVALARVRAARGRIREAIATVRRALALSGEIRAMTANPEYRSSIAASIRPALALEIDLLRKEYESFEARGLTSSAESVAFESLEAVDGFRASAFEEWRAENLNSLAKGRTAQLLATSMTLDRDLAERRYQLATRENVAGPDDARARSLREDIAHLRVRLGLVDAEIARDSSTALGGTPTSGARAGVGRYRSILTPGRAFIEYWLGPERAYAWVLDEHGMSWVNLPSSSLIESAARKLHAAMRSLSDVSPGNRLQDSVELYHLVLAPVMDSIRTADRLVIIPDGSLHYVPFAALRDDRPGRQPYLIQHATVSIAPALRFSAARSGMENRLPQGSRMLMVADPVYTADDPRLHAPGTARVSSVRVIDQRAVLRGMETPSGLLRLAASAREAEQIRDVYGRERVDYLQGTDATRENVLRRDLSSYRFIHIASHGLIDAEIPQLSALILGTYGTHGTVKDPFLRAGDLLAQTFSAEAVVLSACDTALGKESASEGLVGLRYAALARGAHSVVASLWPVADEIAAELMTGMYRKLMRDEDNSSAEVAHSLSEEVSDALAIAMRRALEQAPELDPALWGAFTVYVAGD